MDTLTDSILDRKDEIIGATEEKFLEWLGYNLGLNINFSHDMYRGHKRKIMELLRDEFWDEFVEDAEIAYLEK